MDQCALLQHQKSAGMGMAHHGDRPRGPCLADPGAARYSEKTEKELIEEQLEEQPEEMIDFLHEVIYLFT